MIIILRPGRSTDAQLLHYWDRQPHVIASGVDDDWNWEAELQREPAWREQLVAELDGRPIGFIQIIDAAEEETHYWGDTPPNILAIDIWIGEKEDLGKGYGTVMMNAALDRCFSNEKITAVLIDPLATNIRAHRFYERLGFKFVEYRNFGDDHCAVYRIERGEWESKKHIR